jgi:hypothetical protein
VTEQPRVEVTRIVEDIRDEVARRRASGDLTAEDIQGLLDRRLIASIAKARIDDRIAARLMHGSHDWNIDAEYRIRTTRSGLSGFLVRAAKLAVRPFVKLYTDQILKRQSQLNLALWHVLMDSLEHGVALEMEIRKLQREVKDLKDRA